MSLHTNQRLLVQELLARGVEVRILVRELELLEAELGSHRELILDRDSSICPYSSCVVSGDKYLTKKLLARAGLCVAKGEQFHGDQKEDALRFAARSSFPLVVKPCIGSHGRLCFTGLRDCDQVATAIDRVVAADSRAAYMIEEQFDAPEYRVFVTAEGKFAVLHREAASVIGDGQRTIRELAEAESERRRTSRTSSLCAVIVDEQVERFLAASGRGVESVLPANEKVSLRSESNLALGGMSVDVTDSAHASLVAIAKGALHAVPGLRYAGIDILSRDIRAPQSPGGYVILEVNSNPGLQMHARPGKGAPRNVASYLADLIFPETKAGLSHDTGERRSGSWLGQREAAI